MGQEDPLEEGPATHSSILPWRIPWTEEPDMSIESQRVRHDLVTEQQQETRKQPDSVGPGVTDFLGSKITAVVTAAMKLKDSLKAKS